METKQVLMLDDYISIMQYENEAQDIANSGWNYTDTNSFITFYLFG